MSRELAPSLGVLPPLGERPSAHAGLHADELPPLRPATDARTPLEAARLPPSSDAAASAGVATVSKAPSPAAGSADVLAQLEKLQRATQAAAGDPARSWGAGERRILAVLESSSELEPEEAEEEVREALAEAPAPSASAVDSEGFLLLHYAGMYGSTEGIKYLMQKRANVNSRTKMHETPLILAAFYRHAEACALLIAHKARLDLADWQGRTALAAARASRCGHGPHNNGQAQARCVELLTVKTSELKVPKEVEEFRVQGNEHFKKRLFKDAVASYSLGLSFFDDAALYANRSACYLSLERFVEAKMDAQKAVGLSGEAGHEKASWRLARAALSLGELDRAEEAAREGLRRSAGSKSLEQMLRDVAVERRKRLGS